MSTPSTALQALERIRKQYGREKVCCGNPVPGMPGDGWMQPPDSPSCCMEPEEDVGMLLDVVAAELSAQAAPADELTACNCRWRGDEQLQQCKLHEAHVDAIHDWAERAKTAEAALAARTQTDAPVQAAAATAREFTNELGNAIRITIEGPTSVSENVLTPMEVRELTAALNAHAAADTARKMIAYCRSFKGQQWGGMEESADRQNLAVALENLEETASMLLSMAHRDAA